MGLSISYPPDDYLPVEDNVGRLFIRSLSFDDLKALESPPEYLRSLSSARLMIKGSSFKRKDVDQIQLETTVAMKSPKIDKVSCNSKPTGLRRYGSIQDLPPGSPLVGMVSPKHQAAAVRLQKVYKSFRTRRQLADCAVLVEQSWWKLLDFALLKRNSVLFFEIEKPESAVSRWSRARMRAAKVGKGLSKDDKAQKLALQHWLEAIDPRHRYGHNLHFYYQHWLRCESIQPFFYWLDVGEGKEVNLEEHCPRWKLLQQCIKYLGPKEREAYEVIVENERLMYRQSQKVLDMSEGPKDTKWIFVLSTTKILYVGQKHKGTFQHSSFLAGGATSAAGRLVVENGILKAVWPHSGHYRPTEENFREFMTFLMERNVDLTNVKLCPSEGEEDGWFRQRSSHSHFQLTESCKPDKQEEESQPSHSDEQTITDNAQTATCSETTVSTPETKGSSSSSTATNRLQRKRPSRLHLNANSRPWCVRDKNRLSLRSNDNDQDAGAFGDCLDFCKENLFWEKVEDEEVVVPQEKILNRINSKKAMNSYQLGKQLSFRWTTGAGPRIGCVRDYPWELQLRALEQVSLSPRSTGPSRSAFASPWPGPYTSPGSPKGLMHASIGTPTPKVTA